MEDRIYLLKIRLLDIKPEIWRRFVVPANISLDKHPQPLYASFYVFFAVTQSS